MHNLSLGSLTHKVLNEIFDHCVRIAMPRSSPSALAFIRSTVYHNLYFKLGPSWSPALTNTSKDHPRRA
ncbi:hypothetical protein FGO68_gene1191 [Halteria grandinella]|uniref:Uncharacterized protein n=1 Tax=Halteria grandinella TaxID=5974 RepID=A0A8J8T701_HALGN|nr:hypothetical protein FGO68_gene1191 [Halteria grandinella]